LHTRSNPHRARRKPPGFPARLSVAAVAAVATVSFLAMAAPAGASTASPSAASATAVKASPARASTVTTSAQVKQTTARPADLVQPTTPSDVPYKLPVQLPSTASSPTVASDAPYTPAVLNLIAQLEPSSTPTEAELANASILFHGGTNTTCNNVGPTAAPTGTTPSIMPPCWTDAQGVNTFSGPNAEATTGPTTLMNLASSFDTQLANVWGETEGTEARELMVTGLFGPQTDIDRLPNWGRNLTTTGEDPNLSSAMVAAQINGIQGAGSMSEMKHFAVYNGQNQSTNTEITDQALHQVYLAPYEAGFVQGRASATMCSYQEWQDTSTTLPATVSSLSATAPVSPYATAGQNPQTWPLDEAHYSCEQPLTLTYALRDLWGSVAMVGSDYPATHSTSAISQGEDQEQPTTNGYFSDSNSLSITGGGFSGPPAALDPTGDTCADASGNAESCSAAGAVHVAGVPGPGCPATGCTLVQAVANGSVPLSVFNQALALMLYQEQRFGMLGCNQTPVAASCTNQGGVNGNTTGDALLPTGPAHGATPSADLGTKNGDAAVVEKESEEGAVLLKNDSSALPITRSDLSGGILVTGPGAEYTIADPTGEASVGFADRDAISPLEQLKQFTGDSSAFDYVPANSPSGEPVPSSALSDSATSVTGHLDRTTGPGSPSADSSINYTTASGSRQLAPGDYTWTGYVYVPTTDAYTFRFQFSSGVPASDVTFSLDGAAQKLSTAADVYGQGVTSAHSAALPGSPTDTGYTESGLTNLATATSTLTGGTYHPITITYDNATSAPASFRFAYSRANGDIADAAAAAKGKKLAVVFLNDNNATTTIPNPYGSSPATISSPEALTAANTQLVEAVAAANPNTVVVLNTINPVLMPWIGSVKSVLEMWFSGEEGGTSTARLLLGLANPSGHTDITWPANATDTIWGYNETAPLYSGDTTGPHLERLNGGTGGTTDETEGIYNGYRFFDKEGITPLFPFGWGLSYTSFNYSGLRVARSSDGGLQVSVRVTNTGSDPGSAVAQVYLGAPSNAPAGIQFAVRQLSGFGRVTLNPGQSTVVSVHVPLRQLQYWSSAQQKWITASGSRTVYVGDADALSSLPQRATVTIPGSGTVTCNDEQLSAVMVQGNVVVPPGAWCDVIDSSIAGSLLVSGTGVRVAESTIGGSLVSTGVRTASDPLSDGANVVCDTTVRGNLSILDSGKSAPWNLGQCGGNTVKGNLTFRANAASGNMLTGNTIGGSLSCSGGGSTAATGNKVTGRNEGQCAQ
jgi:beta-glucosidase